MQISLLLGRLLPRCAIAHTYYSVCKLDIDSKAAQPNIPPIKHIFQADSNNVKAIVLWTLVCDHIAARPPCESICIYVVC